MPSRDPLHGNGTTETSLSNDSEILGSIEQQLFHVKKILALIYPFTKHRGYGSTEGQETLKTKSKDGTNTMVNMSTRGDMQRRGEYEETR